MNKTVSVHISGMMFVLDEEAYHCLSAYLLDVRKHFVGIEGEEEIVSDIEARVAELLHGCLDGQKQVIDLPDVEKVIGKLGQPWQMDDQANKKENNASNSVHHPRKLSRDLSSAKLAGVAAGLAQYFNADPLLIRILFLLLIFASGAGILVYLALWLILPSKPSGMPPERGAIHSDRQNRYLHLQMFRDNENKKLAGVAAGLAYYFGIDPWITRLMFVILTFFSGLGLLVYILLWIITPEALSTADKLRMKGRPVDVKNIERHVKEAAARASNLVNKMGFEAGYGFRRAGREARPLIRKFVILFTRVVAILLGTILFFAGLFLTALLFFLFSGWEGFTFFEDIELSSLPINLIDIVVPDPALAQLARVSFGGFLFIPVLLMIYVGLRLLFGHHFSLPGISHLAGILWVLSLIGLIYLAFYVSSDFVETANTELSKIPIENQRSLVVVADGTDTKNYEKLVAINNQRFVITKTQDRIFLMVMPHLYIDVIKNGEQPNITVDAMAKGKNEDMAVRRSQNLSYAVNYRNDTLFMPVWLSYDATYGLRGQRLNIRLNLPDSTRIRFDSGLENFFIVNPQEFWRKANYAGQSVLLTRKGMDKISWQD